MFKLLSVERRLQHEHQPDLVLGPLETGHDEVVLEYDQVGAGRILPSGADDTGRDGTLLLKYESYRTVLFIPPSPLFLCFYNESP